MNRILYPVAAAIALVAAPAHADSAVERMLRKAPSDTYVASASLLALEGCIALKFERGTYHPSVVHSEGRTDIILSKGGFIVSIFDRGSERYIELRRLVRLPQVRKFVEACIAETTPDLSADIQ